MNGRCKSPNIIQILPSDLLHLFAVCYHHHSDLVAMKSFAPTMELDTTGVWLVLNNSFCTVVPSVEISHI